MHDLELQVHTDDSSNSTEYAALGNTYSPMLHRVKQVIQHRAIHPNDPVPPAYEILTKYMHPPDELMEIAMPYVEKVREAADVKKSIKYPPHQFSAHLTPSSPTQIPQQRQALQPPQRRKAALQPRRRRPPLRPHQRIKLHHLPNQRHSRIQASPVRRDRHRRRRQRSRPVR